MDIDNDPTLSAFRESLSTYPTALKQAMLLSLTESLRLDSEAAAHKTINFNEYVQLVPDFLPDSYLDAAIIAEVESMGFDPHSKKPQSRWLSSDDRAYCFSENHQKHTEGYLEPGEKVDTFRNTNHFDAVG